MLDPGKWLDVSLLWMAALPACCFTASLYTWITNVLGRMWRKEIRCAVGGREVFYLRYQSFMGQIIFWMKVVRELQVWANGNFRECVIGGADSFCGEARAYEYREKKTVKALADARTVFSILPHSISSRDRLLPSAGSAA